MSSKHKPEASTDVRAMQLQRRAERLAKSPAEREEEERIWQRENAEAIRSMNAYFEEHGFPFPQYRRY
jgi:post-segregation antitoxin (ccd killing protein)